MSEENIKEFHNFIQSLYPSHKQTTGRAYGTIKLVPRAFVSIFVQSKCVKVEFWTKGRYSDLSGDDLIEWSNSSGILREEIMPDVYFRVQRGAKNKDKVSVEVRIPLSSTDELESDEIRQTTRTALEAIISNLGELAQVRKGSNKGKSSNEVEEAEVSNAQEVVESIKGKLDSIIDSNVKAFEDEQSTKVRPGYGYDKFYLSRIDGSYDSSLQGLIHYILWEDGLYAKLLPKEELKKVAQLVQEEPEAIYTPDTFEDGSEEMEALRELIDSVYWDVITHVGGRLSELSFFDNSEFINLGYTTSSPDDEEEDENAVQDNKQYLYMMRIGIEDGYGLEGDALIEACADSIVRHGLLLKETAIECESFYILAQKETETVALKVPTPSETDQDQLTGKVSDSLKSKFIPSEIFSEEYGSVSILFYAAETEDEDLWRWEFNRLAEDSQASITIIGWHSSFEDYVIQSWAGGEYDEGAESNSDIAEEYYVGLETGESLKVENLKESDFELQSYAQDSL